MTVTGETDQALSAAVTTLMHMVLHRSEMPLGTIAGPAVYEVTEKHRAGCRDASVLD